MLEYISFYCLDRIPAKQSSVSNYLIPIALVEYQERKKNFVLYQLGALRVISYILAYVLFGPQKRKNDMFFWQSD
jgi:hypothetical protein